MRYPDSGGLTAAWRARREQLRFEAAELGQRPRGEPATEDEADQRDPEQSSELKEVATDLHPAHMAAPPQWDEQQQSDGGPRTLRRDDQAGRALRLPESRDGERGRCRYAR